MIQAVVVTRTTTPEGDFAFATTRNRQALEIVARGLEAEGFTVAIQDRKSTDDTYYFLSASRKTAVVLQ